MPFRGLKTPLCYLGNVGKVGRFGRGRTWLAESCLPVREIWRPPPGREGTLLGLSDLLSHSEHRSETS